MRVPFRQGIVHAPANFLSLASNKVSLTVPPNEVIAVTFADGNSDYLLNENSSVPGAWQGPFLPDTNYWLYWDLNTQTGAKTYGSVQTEPVEGPNAPANPVDRQHWFNTSEGVMYEWNSVASKWQRRVRVFAAALYNGTVFVSMSINSPSFIGTQVGDLTTVNAGVLVFDSTGSVLKKGDGTFFTTEDTAIAGTSSNTHVKIESAILQAKATTNIAAYTMVRLMDYFQIAPATNLLADPGVYGIIEVDASTDDLVNVVRDGIITNTAWDWTGAGVNAPVYVNAYGQLTTTPQASMAVGVVVSPNSVLLTSTVVDVVTQIESTVTINSPTEGVSVVGDTGPTSSVFNVVLRDDLAAIEALNTNGVAHRDGDGVWTARLVNVTTEVDGVLSTINGGTGTSELQEGYVKSTGLVGAPLVSLPTVPGYDVTGDISGNAANVNGIVAIENGGTGAATRSDAANAILPAQDVAGTIGKALFSDGQNVEWRNVTDGTVTSVGISTTAQNIQISNSPITSAGNIIVSLAGNLHQLDSLDSVGFMSRDSAGNILTHTITSQNNTITITNGDGGASGNTNIGLPVVNLPNVYAEVVTDEFGRVTSGTQNLSWAKISNTPNSVNGYGIIDAYTKTEVDAHQWSWSSINTTPTTLNGYGIADAYTKTEVNALTWDWGKITNTPSSLNDYGITDAVKNSGGVLSIELNATINKPAAGVTGRLFIDTTTNTLTYDDGNVWTEVGKQGTVTQIAIESLTDGISVANGQVTSSGTVSLSLSGDLAAVEGITTYGFTSRTADGTWTTRAILGATGEIDVTNSDGIAGNVVISMPNVVTPGNYAQVTVDAKGRVTGGVASSGVEWSGIINTPTTLTGYGINDGVSASSLGVAGGIATLDGSGKIPTSQLPAVAITDTYVVNSQAEMLSLNAQVGDVAIRLDENKTFILQSAAPTILSSWQEILSSNGGGGTGVFYINASSNNNNLTVTGGPIIDTGTLSFGLSGNLLAVSNLSTSGFVKNNAGAWSAVGTLSLTTDTTGTLPVNRGGTGQTSLTGYLKGTGSAVEGVTSIPAADVMGDITGNAVNVTGVVGIANGGTGATTPSAALNAFLPAQNGGGVFISDGTTPSWSTSIPASYVTGTVGDAAALGGVSAVQYVQTSGLTTTLNDYALKNGSNSSGTWTIDINGNATNVTGVVSVVNGGTGVTSVDGIIDLVLPDRTGNDGKILSTSNNIVEWITPLTGYTTVSSTGVPMVQRSTINFSSVFYISDTLDATTVNLHPTLNNIVDDTWTGSTSVTTLGAVTTGTWNADTVAITHGGTGATTAEGAINALLPDQTGKSGQILSTDGTSPVWIPVPPPPAINDTAYFSFDDTVFSGSDVYSIFHNLDDDTPIIQLYDNTNRARFDVPVYAVSGTQLDLDFTGIRPLMGSWRLKVKI